MTARTEGDMLLNTGKTAASKSFAASTPARCRRAVWKNDAANALGMEVRALRRSSLWVRLCLGLQPSPRGMQAPTVRGGTPSPGQGEFGVSFLSAQQAWT